MFLISDTHTGNVCQDVDPRFPQQAGIAEWPEPVTLKPLATSRNAATGFYGGWNSKASLAYANSPNNPSYYFGPFHRAHVIDDYLASHDDLTFAEQRKLSAKIGIAKRGKVI